MSDDALDYAISPEASALLLTCFGLLGSSAATLLIRTVLAAIGFGAVGVTKGSFAAWWQSTMGIVPSKSLFSMLQSIAMRQQGVTTATLSVGSLVRLAGGAAVPGMMVEICKKIDAEVETNSYAGVVIRANAKAVEKFMLAIDSAKRQSSDLISDAGPAMEAARKFAFEAIVRVAQEHASNPISIVSPALEAAKDHSAKLMSEAAPAIDAAKQHAKRIVSDAAPHVEEAKQFVAGIAADPASTMQAVEKFGKAMISAWNRPIRSRL